MPVAFHTKNITLTSLLVLICVIPFGLQAREVASQQEKGNNELYTIVIDPGHGGKHPGTIWQGGKYKEKDIVLEIALKLGTEIKKEFPGIHVVYTRTTDRYVDLSERSAIANRCKADLFLSIHVNAAKSASVNGTETFVMGTSKNDANFELLKAENSVITVEKDYRTKYEGFDPSSPESYIIFSLIQNTHLESSLSFAEIIEKKYQKNSPINSSRGVKQGGLLVLWQCTMPAVLTEIGFLSNKDDRGKLLSSAERSKIADALLEAVSEYVVSSVPEETLLKLKAVVPAPTVKSATVAVQPSAVTVKISANKAESQEYFSVQILSATKKLSSNSPELKGEKNVFTINSSGLYKHLIGNYKTRDEAAKACVEVRKKFPGAFVVRVKENQIVK